MTKNANDYQYWSKTADRFDAATEYIAGVKTLEAAKHWLSNQLIATDVALEIGCGTGLYSSVIADRVQHLTATDMSPEMLSKARARLQAYSNVTIEFADAYQTKYAEQSFDVVFMGNVVRIVQEPVTVLREGHRLLKAGGRLLSIDYTTRGMSGIAQLGMVMRYLSRYGLPPRTMREYRLDELVELVQGLEFEIQDAQVVTRETNVLCLCAIKKMIELSNNTFQSTRYARATERSVLASLRHPRRLSAAEGGCWPASFDMLYSSIVLVQ